MSNLKEAIIVQFYPEDSEQAYVTYLDLQEVKDRTDPTHPKHDTRWSNELFNAIKRATKSSSTQVDWDIQDYADSCSAKLPFRVRKHSITLYI